MYSLSVSADVEMLTIESETEADWDIVDMRSRSLDSTQLTLSIIGIYSLLFTRHVNFKI